MRIFSKKKNEELKEKYFPYWTMPIEKVIDHLKSGFSGLSEKEASRRLKKYGENLLKTRRKTSDLYLLLNQFRTPLIALFLATAILSFFLKENINSIIILLIVIISGMLGFYQERNAVHITEKLIAMVKVKSEVLRDSEIKNISTENIVLGDVIVFNAGDIVPADCLIFESKDLFVDESMLTGETFAVEKMEGQLKEATALNKRSNTLFMGSHVISGIAKAIVVSTGKTTQFGKVLKELKSHGIETDFEKSIKKISIFLLQVTLVLISFIFIFNIFLHRSIITSVLFSLALAIGLSPQLLPAIISVNLAHGARIMKRKKVIVKRIPSIENFGSMNILCADKTGTLTEGKIRFHSIESFGEKNEDKISLFAYLNSKLQSGYTNPIDETILVNFKSLDNTSGFQKIDELPYDFSRKRLTIVTQKGPDMFVITKGALSQVLQCCKYLEKKEGKLEEIKPYLQEINKKFEEFSSKGFRVLGISYRNIDSLAQIGKDVEKEMVFLGFLVFFDPLKKDIKKAIDQLVSSGINLKIITGDNFHSAVYAANELNLNPNILIGSQLNKLSNKALANIVYEKNVFAEIEPIQKERIIQSLRSQNFVVGYLGDGINDASALHSADIGISVNTAVDAAKEAADIILLDKSLKVLLDGVQEGRKTFANTLKYIFMATSANFGNMFSMAGASLFLKFLPLLPEQILFNNLLTDIPEMTIGSDSVDNELINKPVRLNIKFIMNFMLVFGLISSVFDYATFFSLIKIFKATPEEFRTGWFIESVISATSIILVIRTRKPFFRSKPSIYLALSVFSILIITLIIPFTFVGKIFHFDILRPSFYLLIIIIMVLYVIMTEIAKKIFYKKQSL